MAEDYRIGDHWGISDLSGRKFRMSEMVRQWNGLLVHQSEWEPRHPQELVRNYPREKPVRVSKPRPLDTFIGPLTAELSVAAQAGATLLVLDSAERMAAYDQISICLDDKDVQITTILAVSDTTNIEIADPLRCSARIGSVIVNTTAMALPTTAPSR